MRPAPRSATDVGSMADFWPEGALDWSSPRAWTIGGFTDGSSNTILFGESTTLQLCVPNAAYPAGITDGTSNTIQFGETIPSRCYREVGIGSSLDVAVPAPGATPLLGLALAALVARRRRRG